MSIAASSTEHRPAPVGSAPQVGLGWRDAAADVRTLLAFRRAGSTPESRRRLSVGVGLLVGITLAAVLVPAFVYAGSAADRPGVSRAVALLPTLLLVVLVLSILSGIASGGGRELLARDQAVAFPVSPLTDHLGALLLAPLNMAWLLQAWTVLGTMAYLSGPAWLPLSILPVVLWLVVATALGQAAAWVVEWIRRGPRGAVTVRALGLGVVALAVLAVATDSVLSIVDSSPTVYVMIAGLEAAGGVFDEFYLPILAGLLAAVPAVVWLGSFPARWASSRAPRDEHALETGFFRPRSDARSDLAMLRRLDRAAVWRSVPLRRGVLVLALLPGLVAIAGAMEWREAMIVPGLVASGCVLLFGVNAWALEGRGMLWRESLPVDPGVVFAGRLLVLLEVIAVGMLATLVMAGIRAGLPSVPEGVALACVCVVVLLQVGAAGMRWSVSKPFAVDLRSSRATPAPPAVMVGYSARLALTTTLTGVFFGVLAAFPQVRFTLVFAVLFAVVSLLRLVRASARWSDPLQRARVVMTVAG